jgi:hypothetical protein
MATCPSNAHWRTAAMKTPKTLLLVALFAATAALAGRVPKDLPKTPCADKGTEVQQECSASCFKVDPNKKDQTPTKAEMKCMEGCNKKGAAVTVKCEADAAAKADTSKKERDPAKEVEY